MRKTGAIWSANYLATGLRLDPLTAPDDRDRVTDAILTTARPLHQTPRELIFNFADPRLGYTALIFNVTLLFNLQI